MWARLGPPLARLLFLAAVVLALPMSRSFFRADYFAISSRNGMLQPTGDGLTGSNGWVLVESDRGNLVITKAGPNYGIRLGPDMVWFSHDGAHLSSRRIDWSGRSPPPMQRTIGGQAFGICFWVSWPMKQPPRTFRSTYLFATPGGPDFQIALPLPVLVSLMALPYAIIRWQRWKCGRPRGFEIDAAYPAEQV